MRRPRNEAPRREDIATGNYDAEYLLGTYQHLELARSRDADVCGRSASGGVITETLSALLDAGELDAVLSVGFAAGDPITPRYLVSRNREQLLNNSGSVYSYISPKDLLKALNSQQQGRLAVVCQPCMVPFMRRIQNRSWKEDHGGHIKLIISFFCGYNMTPDATTYLLGKAGVAPKDVEWIRYRHGEYPGGFAVKAKGGPKAGQVLGFGKEAYEYVNLAFLRGGCSRCAYYMGDGADLSCGDAWLKEHRGLTAVLARTEAGRAALDNAGARLERYELPEKTLMEMHLHNLNYKKYGNSLPMRMLTTFFGEVLPKPLAPFRLLCGLSKMRRRRKIGTSLPRLTLLNSEAVNEDHA